MSAADVVLVCGIPSESPVMLVTDALVELGQPFVLFNQRAFEDVDFSCDVGGGEILGELRVGRERLSTDRVAGVYTRMMDDRQLPEFRALPAGGAGQARCRALHDALNEWMEVAPARVVNRMEAMATNCSKPFQAQLIAAAGFAVPDTVITNDPDVVRAFQAAHGRVIYKSASSVRSIVRVLDSAALDRLDRVRWCPTQFQAQVEGTDVRVHVVGTEVFATEIETDATDYRYAVRDGGRASLRPGEVPPDIAARCVALARALGLAFAGIDLRRTPDGRWVCFEANPSPGFSFYEHATGQPIADAVARYLAGRMAA